MKFVEIKNNDKDWVKIIPKDVYGILFSEIPLMGSGHLKYIIERRLKKLFDKHSIVYRINILPQVNKDNLIILFERNKNVLSPRRSPERFAKSKKGNPILLNELDELVKGFNSLYQKTKISSITPDMNTVLQYNKNEELLLTM